MIKLYKFMMMTQPMMVVKQVKGIYLLIGTPVKWSKPTACDHVKRLFKRHGQLMGVLHLKANTAKTNCIISPDNPEH